MPYTAGPTIVSDKLLYITGPTGESGADGSTGPTGPQGPAGAGSNLTSATVALHTDGLFDDAALPLAALVNLQGSTAVHTIRGVESSPVQGAMHPVKEFYNSDSYNKIWTNEDGSVVSGKRIILPEGSSFTQAPGTSVFLTYDYVALRWRKTPESVLDLTSVTITVSSTGTLANASLAKSSTANLTSSAAYDVQGITAATALGAQFPQKIFVNTGSYPFTFKNENGTATAANRVRTPNAIDFVLRSGETCYLDYDYTASRWILTTALSSHRSVMVVDLCQRVGAFHGEKVHCIGFYYSGNGAIGVTGAGDGGGGVEEWVWDSTSARVPNGGTVMGHCSIGLASAYRDPATGLVVSTFQVSSAGSSPGLAVDSARPSAGTDTTILGPGSLRYTHIGQLWAYRAPGDASYGANVAITVDGSATLFNSGATKSVLVTIDVSDATADGTCTIRFENYYPDQDGYAIIPDVGAPLGRWVKNVKDAALLNPKWFGALGQSLKFAGFISDHNAHMAMMRASRPFGAKWEIPEGVFLFDRNFEVSGDYIVGNLWWQGCAYTGSAPAATIYRYNGEQYWNGTTSAPAANDSSATDAVLIGVNTTKLRMEGLRLEVAGSKHVACLLNVGAHETSVTVHGNTRNTFVRCSFGGNSATRGAQSAEYTVIMDYFRRQGGNMENCAWRECEFGNGRTGLVKVRDSIQPYNTTFIDCSWGQFLHTVANQPYGIGMHWENPSGSFSITTSDIQRVACPLYFTNPPFSWSLIDCVSEQYKKLIYGMGGTNQTIMTGGVYRGRFSVGGVNDASEGPLTTWGAGDYKAIQLGGTVNLRLDGVCFHDGYNQETNWICSVTSGDVISTGCIYPHIKPFFKEADYIPSQKQGGVWQTGDTCPSWLGGYQISMPQTFGCVSGGGLITFASGDTVKAVTLTGADGVAYPEGTGGNGYKVRFQLESFTGTIAPADIVATSITNTGFNATRTVAPGGGTATYRWIPHR